MKPFRFFSTDYYRKSDFDKCGQLLYHKPPRPCCLVLLSTPIFMEEITSILILCYKRDPVKVFNNKRAYGHVLYNHRCRIAAS